MLNTFSCLALKVFLATKLFYISFHTHQFYRTSPLAEYRFPHGGQVKYHCLLLTTVPVLPSMITPKGKIVPCRQCWDSPPLCLIKSVATPKDQFSTQHAARPAVRESGNFRSACSLLLRLSIHRWDTTGVSFSAGKICKILTVLEELLGSPDTLR